MMSETLICLPFAGAGASFFRRWQRLAPEGLSILPVQLPGREERFSEKLCTDVGEALDDIRPRVLAQISETHRAAVFGHSLGASLAYEIARQLAGQGVEISRLFVSGAPSPKYRDVERVSELDDLEFLEGLRRVAGYHHPAMDHPEMLEIMMPALRADSVMHEKYRSAHTEPVNFGITALRGRDDALVSATEAAQWALETRATFHVKEIDGQHMYLTDNPEALLRTISLELKEQVNHG
jgi:surfactin synthase thioesterase subunit